MPPPEGWPRPGELFVGLLVQEAHLRRLLKLSWLAPDIVAELSSADEANNRDPALAAIVDAIHAR